MFRTDICLHFVQGALPIYRVETRSEWWYVVKKKKRKLDVRVKEQMNIVINFVVFMEKIIHFQFMDVHIVPTVPTVQLLMFCLDQPCTCDFVVHV